MNTDTYLASINADGLDHKRVQWQSRVKPAAAHAGRDLRKVCTAIVMTGAAYADLAVNAETETGDLPWGQWALFPHIITHKDTFYARLYTVDGTVKTTYFVDGEVTDKATFDTFLTPSQRQTKRPNGGCITVTLDNIKVVA